MALSRDEPSSRPLQTRPVPVCRRAGRISSELLADHRVLIWRGLSRQSPIVGPDCVGRSGRIDRDAGVVADERTRELEIWIRSQYEGEAGLEIIRKLDDIAREVNNELAKVA